MIVIATFHLELFHIINHFSRKHYEIKQTSRCKNPFSFNRNIPNRIPKINKLPITTNKISSQISNMITDIQRNIQYKIATRKSLPSNNRLNREIPSNHEYPPTTTSLNRNTPNRILKINRPIRRTKYFHRNSNIRPWYSTRRSNNPYPLYLTMNPSPYSLTRS